jgi:ParB family transcriptional regulator, chromosome partitioning protein
MSEVRSIFVSSIDPDPDQPRKHFEEASLRELAASIKTEGLIQPISVRRVKRRYMIVAGERRFRAHKLAGLKRIAAIVSEPVNKLTVMVRQIVENAQRRDVSPIEEAVAFQRCLDAGMSVADLAVRLGLQQPWRIEERTCLLRLRPEYQALLRTRQLTNSQGYELAQLSPLGQDKLFAKIRVGACATYDALRAASLAIRDGEAQLDLVGGTQTSESERRMVKSFESRIAKVASALRASVVNNEVIAVRKVNRDQAMRIADLMVAMKGDLSRIESALRCAARPELL